MQEARLQSWGKINRSRVKFVLRYAGHTVLDLGCATGTYVAYLNARGYNAFGLDLLVSPEWTAGACPERSVGEKHVYVQGTADYLPFPDRVFDTVTAFEVLEHVPKPTAALHEIRRVCRKNTILSVPDCETPVDLLRAGLTYAHWRDRSHCSFFTQQSLQDILERAGFQIETMTRINTILPDFLALRSLHLPTNLAYLASRLLRRLPLRKQYRMTLLAVANRIEWS